MEENEKSIEEKTEEKRKLKLAAAIQADFESRREQRRQTENCWVLNMNFLNGNQYCDVSPFGGVENEDKQFYWQSRRIFNHIAPTIDSRMAKLVKLRPELKVKAFSDEEADLKAAKLSTGVLKYVWDRIGLASRIDKATLWAEVCGSAFYKIVWDDKGGRQVASEENGAPVYEGEIAVDVIPPFEIFPDSLDAESLDSIHSLIHAQAVPVSYILEKFGVELKGRSILETDLSPYSQSAVGNHSFTPQKDNPLKENAEILIERYSRPTERDKDGKLEIAAGGVLLYEGPLPYQNGERGERIFPFVQQNCLRLPGAFFGSSIVDRLVPVQRAYNAVRNRKHEFLNRLSLGVITVEDGSVDTDDLAENGISPGKILVYRQGGKAPEMLDCGDVPSEFAHEEEWLEKEFTLISGVSDLTQNSTPTQVTSASGLKLLLTEDEERLSVTTTNVSEAMKDIGRQILRLYKQQAGNARLIRLTGENKKTQIRYFNASDLSSNDIIFETEELGTPETKKETIMTLLNAGLFANEDGKISMENKNRILEAFGFGNYENARDISALHIAKAEEENCRLIQDGFLADSYDDHDLHIVEHTRFLLSDEFRKIQSPILKERFCSHIADHEKKRKIAAIGKC